MRLRSATFTDVGGTSVRKTLATVGAATDDLGVVVVLAVVLPSALNADLVASPLGQGDVAAPRTGVRPA